MIYLVIRIFAYLVVAALGGVVAGWLWRNTSAQSRDDALTRTLNDARGRIVQLEALIRARDEQLRQRHLELGELRQTAGRGGAEAIDHPGGRRATVPMPQVLPQARAATGARDAKDSMGATAAETDALRHELETMRRSVATREALDAARRQALEADVETLRGQLATSARSQSRERERVVELERERALQVKSLKVLHQQLELARADHMRVLRSTRPAANE